MSLYEINEYIRQVIALNFTEPVWIKAEVNQVSFSRGHCYLELIEKRESTDEIIAQASAAIWYRNLRFIEFKTGSNLTTLLVKGTQVLLKAKVEYSERYGLKFSVEDLDLSFALGQLELKRRETIAELERKGLIQKNKRQVLPPVLQRLAIISSEKAAGLQDFINHLRENAYDFAFRCELFDAAMQGKNVETDIIKACNKIGAEKLPYDAVILIRGGGSKLDLAAFDSLKLCIALANLKYPVITGIGHDVDQSIADLVAHTSLKTPTAVANFVVDHNLVFESSVFDNLRTIENTTRNIIELQNRYLQNQSQKIKQFASRSLQKHHFNLLQSHKDLTTFPKMILERAQRELDRAQELITLLDPYVLLKRGYSMTTFNGRLLKDVSKVKAGDSIETLVSNGSISSIVK